MALKRFWLKRMLTLLSLLIASYVCLDVNRVSVSNAKRIYQHRIAMNSWHGKNKPLAPTENASLERYQIVFNSKEQLQKAVAALVNIEENGGEYWTSDPTGNKLLLTHKS